MQNWATHNQIPLDDTGSLRGDLLAYLQAKGIQRAELMAVFGVRLAEFVAEDADAARQLAKAITAAQGLDELWDRAAARGEIDPDTLTPRLRALPFDLVGAELARTGRPLPIETIEEILDTIVLPLVSRPPANP